MAVGRKMGCMTLQDSQVGSERLCKFCYLNSIFHLIGSSSIYLHASTRNPASVFFYIYPHRISSVQKITMYITLGDNYLLLYYNLHQVVISSHSSQP